MSMAKKAQGISLTTVVIAAVALIVLVVLILIFSGRLQLFNKGVNSCPAKTFEAKPGQITLGMCPGGRLPVSVIKHKSEDKNVYCCPKE
jgi:hypothetical protein